MDWSSLGCHSELCGPGHQVRLTSACRTRTLFDAPIRASTCLWCPGHADPLQKLPACTVMVRKGHLRSAATALLLLLQSFTLWALVL